MIIARKLVVLNESHESTIKISDVRAPSTNPNRIVFWGWNFDDPDGDGTTVSAVPTTGGTEANGEIRTVNDDDTELERSIRITDTREINFIQPSDADLKKMIYDIWPVFKEARWFYFDTGGSGADYVPARFVMVDEEIDYLSPLAYSRPERPGYRFAGWFCKVEKNGVIYDIQVTDNDNTFNRINLVVTGYDDGDDDSKTLRLNPGVSIVQKTASFTSRVLKMEIPQQGEGELTEQYFYAKWNPQYSADYQVIVWKQKVTDPLGTPSAEKTYDFAFRDTIEDVFTSSISAVYADDNEKYNAKNFDNLSSTDPDFEGFSYRTAVVVNGVGTDNRKVNSDGSTIVNVYYDRIQMNVTFHYRSADLSLNYVQYETYNDDIYIKTEANTVRHPNSSHWKTSFTSSR